MVSHVILEDCLQVFLLLGNVVKHDMIVHRRIHVQLRNTLEVLVKPVAKRVNLLNLNLFIIVKLLDVEVINSSISVRLAVYGEEI